LAALTIASTSRVVISARTAWSVVIDRYARMSFGRS